MSTPGIEGQARGLNELRIEDKNGLEEIYIHAEKDVNAHVKNDWKEHTLHDQHRTIDKWLLHAGNESHVVAGRKTAIEACTELTIKAGAGFIKIDPSGVYIGGTKVRVNSGGSPGKGSGARPLLPHNSPSIDEGTVPQTQNAPLRTSRQTPDQIAKSVNPNKSIINCGYNVDSVIDRLYGTDLDAVSPESLDGTFAEIESRHGTEITWGHNINDAFSLVQQAGIGATAIVGIDYGNGSSHVVVITNDNGTPTIIEAQDWGKGLGAKAITSPAVAQDRYSPSDVGIGMLPWPAR